MNENTKKAIKDIVSEGHYFENEPMAAHTTFRVGGPAEVLVTPDEEELCSLVKYMHENKIEHIILGNGSNVLVSDKGLSGVVVCLGEALSGISCEGDTIVAKAGSRLTAVSVAAKNASLAGLEFAAGIPGSLGGAVMMNAGAYGGQISDTIKSVRYLTPDGEIRMMDAQDLKLSYRHSVFMEEEYKGCIILEATFVLLKGDKVEIEAMMKDFNGRRRDKQPLDYPSAGSTFKRPEGHFAGKLIQDASLAGYSVGGACVSEKHCGFVINKNNATAKDVYNVIRDVQKKVHENTGITLETEVILLGDFS